jgi:hypothetical protein
VKPIFAIGSAALGRSLVPGRPISQLRNSVRRLSQLRDTRSSSGPPAGGRKIRLNSATRYARRKNVDKYTCPRPPPLGAIPATGVGRCLPRKGLVDRSLTTGALGGWRRLAAGSRCARGRSGHSAARRRIEIARQANFGTSCARKRRREFAGFWNTRRTKRPCYVGRGPTACDKKGDFCNRKSCFANVFQYSKNHDRWRMGALSAQKSRYRLLRTCTTSHQSPASFILHPHSEPSDDAKRNRPHPQKCLTSSKTSPNRDEE